MLYQLVHGNCTVQKLCYTPLYSSCISLLYTRYALVYTSSARRVFNMCIGTLYTLCYTYAYAYNYTLLYSLRKTRVFLVYSTAYNRINYRMWAYLIMTCPLFLFCIGSIFNWFQKILIFFHIGTKIAKIK